MSRVQGKDVDVALPTTQREKACAGKKWKWLMEILEDQH